MNVFNAIACSQYANYKALNKAAKSRGAAIIFITISWVLNLGTIFLGWILTKKFGADKNDFETSQLLQEIGETFGSDHIVGRAIVVLAICILYLIAYAIYGGNYFIKIVNQYNSLETEQQISVRKTANIYMLISFILFAAIASVVFFL